MKNDQPVIILGSGSPRRRLLFDFLAIPYLADTADVDERALSAASPREFALKAALAKACAFDERYEVGTIVVTADTVVAFDGKIFFKPTDSSDAEKMLSELSGNTHQVISAIAVREIGRATQLDAVTTKVRLRALSSQEIASYVATGEPLDKAGSYGIQGLGGTLVEEVAGDYYNVVGLPVDKLLEMLESHMNVEPFQMRRQQLTPDIFK